MSDAEIVPMTATMTNDELQTAILHTHTLTQTTCTDEPSYQPLIAHLASLLEIQKTRAALVEIAGADHA